MVKAFVLKKKLKQNVSEFVINGYPEKVEHILVIFNRLNDQIEQFLGKLEDYFKEQATVHKVNLNGKVKRLDTIALNKRSINFKGNFKDNAFNNLLPKINLIIDLSQTDSLVKNYAISLAPQAYKISLNTNHNSQFQLTIKVEPKELNQFFEEVVKYHNALKHG